MMDAADRDLPRATRRTWRWRVLWLRAAFDAELIDIHHAHPAHVMVCPPWPNAPTWTANP